MEYKKQQILLNTKEFLLELCCQKGELDRRILKTKREIREMEKDDAVHESKDDNNVEGESQ